MFDPTAHATNGGFNLYIVGKRGSGKSSILLRLLLTEQGLKNKFQEIFLINPTFEYDEKYHKYNFTKVYTQFSLELIDKLIQYFQNNPTKYRLLIFDDCIAESMFKQNLNDNPLNELVIKGRHWRTSCIFLSQKYNGISSVIRNQLDYLILFDSKNRHEIETIYEEFGGRFTRKDWYEFWDLVFDTPHDNLLIDNTTNKYYKNFQLIEADETSSSDDD